VVRLTNKESAGILKGTTLDVYRFLLKANKPLGLREIQRALNISSPSLVQYYLSKLERVGLVKKDMGAYMINKVLLDKCVKISRFIIPRYLFYSVFSVLILSFELTFFQPEVLGREYFFAVIVTAIFVLIFCYETARVWLKGNL
jgi:hypothetical protein